MSDAPRLGLMLVHAHPDDEAVSTGGTLLRYADEGLATVLVCATGGEEGEIHDPDLDPVEAQPRLGDIRRRELASAAELLKVGALELLDYRDSGMVGTPANEHAASLHQAKLLEATERLVRLIRRHRPSVLVSYNDFGSYGHPDHIKCYQMTREAFARAADPEFAPSPYLSPWQPLKLYEITMVLEEVWRWRDLEREEREKKRAEQPSDTMPSEPTEEELAKKAREHEFFKLMVSHSTPLKDVTTRIDVRQYRDIVVAALRCHRTQFPADSWFFQDRPERRSDMDNYEHFNLARSLVRTTEREDDLFAGLR